jgi:superfamily II DNA or RNA helicase
MGCGVIAQHKVPTLILVDRTPLVDQWKERLREHLGLGPKDIGQLGGGKKTKLTGRVDLATLQSLTRAADPAAILCDNGLVIVDECHHVAAHTFARAIQSIPARRWLGLTATPKRADGREEIMFMHCGQVRHKIPSATDLSRNYTFIRLLPRSVTTSTRHAWHPSVDHHPGTRVGPGAHRADHR